MFASESVPVVTVQMCTDCTYACRADGTLSKAPSLPQLCQPSGWPGLGQMALAVVKLPPAAPEPRSLANLNAKHLPVPVPVLPAVQYRDPELIMTRMIDLVLMQR